MFVEDYGETVRVEICNLMWQPEDKKGFDTVHEAWTFIKDKVDDHFIRVQVRRDKDKKKVHKLKVFKIPDTGKYLVSNTAWDKVLELDSPNEIYDTFAKLIVDSE